MPGSDQPWVPPEAEWINSPQSLGFPLAVADQYMDDLVAAVQHMEKPALRNSIRHHYRDFYDNCVDPRSLAVKLALSREPYSGGNTQEMILHALFILRLMVGLIETYYFFHHWQTPQMLQVGRVLFDGDFTILDNADGIGEPRLGYQSLHSLDSRIVLNPGDIVNPSNWALDLYRRQELDPYWPHSQAVRFGISTTRYFLENLDTLGDERVLRYHKAVVDAWREFKREDGAWAG
ncbi:hypothetical protein F5Y17DRAFT_456361 [Xylariaceae sp. FL0594]|nr:hypothetical protein F5Y17DRAFT_456361 [Xylariaceae sp. FL0594]